MVKVVNREVSFSEKRNRELNVLVEPEDERWVESQMQPEPR